MIWYAVVVHRINGASVTIQFPELGSAEVDVDSKENNGAFLGRLLSEIIETMMEERLTIPRPSEGSNEVPLDIATSIRLALYWHSSTADSARQPPAFFLHQAFERAYEAGIDARAVEAAATYVASLKAVCPICQSEDCAQMSRLGSQSSADARPAMGRA